jgi:hypothetical protein
MKQWLVRKLADENTYFPMFLGAMCIYAMIGVVLFGLTANYNIGAAKYVAILFLFGAAGMGVGGRIVHTLCYAKVNGNKDDSENPV